MPNTSPDKIAITAQQALVAWPILRSAADSALLAHYTVRHGESEYHCQDVIAHFLKAAAALGLEVRPIQTPQQAHDDALAKARHFDTKEIPVTDLLPPVERLVPRSRPIHEEPYRPLTVGTDDRPGDVAKAAGQTMGFR